MSDYSTRLETKPTVPRGIPPVGSPEALDICRRLGRQHIPNYDAIMETIRNQPPPVAEERVRPVALCKRCGDQFVVPRHKLRADYCNSCIVPHMSEDHSKRTKKYRQQRSKPERVTP